VIAQPPIEEFEPSPVFASLDLAHQRRFVWAERVYIDVGPIALVTGRPGQWNAFGLDPDLRVQIDNLALDPRSLVA
jgi:hypothetical protein